MDTTNRLDRPRIILWVGSDFKSDAAFLGDLCRVPLVAVYSESTDTIISSTLVQGASLTNRYPIALTTADEADGWNPATLPIFFLRGRRQDQTSSGLRDRHRRSAMLERFASIAEEYRPSVIALGIAGQAELTELLSVAAEYGSFTPVIVVGDGPRLSQLVSLVLSSPESAMAEPTIVSGGWTELKQHLEQAGVSLLIEDDNLPAVLVGATPVPLAAVLEDADARIDSSWRIVTVKALLKSPPPAIYEGIFDAVMRLDESADARALEDDYKEWWAIGDGFLAERTDLEASVIKVLDALRSEVSRKPQVMWIAAEAGSGATMFLHSIAYRAAEAGFPTLVAKQHARDPLSRQLTDFLTRLQTEARRIGTSEQSEVPALVVLDVPHEASAEMERVPEEVSTAGGRSIITLRAVRIEPDAGLPSPRQDNAVWLSETLADDDANRRLPRRGESVVAILKSCPTPHEIAMVASKAHWLREQRGIALTEDPGATWDAFQYREAFEVDAVLKQGGLQGAELAAAKQAFQANRLFWLALYHFLRVKDKDEREQPLLASLNRRFVTVVDQASAAALPPELVLGVLLEAAKLSSLGIVCPTSALVDWAAEQGGNDRGGLVAGNLASDALGDGSDGATPLSGEQLDKAVHALRNWAAGVRWVGALRGSESTQLLVSRSIDILAREVLLRRHVVGGRTYTSVPSPVLARALLLAAVASKDIIGERLHQAIGGIRAVLFRDHALDGLGNLLSRLTAGQANIQLCEDLSERLLKGDDDSPEWTTGDGERRLAAYDLIPIDIRRLSRVLSHHRALVLRRTTFSHRIDTRTKLERLLLAREDLSHALTLPWQWGERSDHPAFIHTTLGMVLEELARLLPDEASRWRDQSKDALRSAFGEMPTSRHTRLALAKQCLADAKRRAGSDPATAGLVAECLQLLSVEPTGQFKKWYAVKSEAARFFGDEAGRQFVEDLCKRGIEDGFLLKTELLLHEAHGDIQAGLKILAPLIVGDQAAVHPRACRRAAELMEQEPSLRSLFEERLRLLKIVEVSLNRLTPNEEFQLACLSFQLGDVAEGRRRFTVFRATGRSSDVAGEDKPFLMDAEGIRPLRCRAVVSSLDGARGWMRLETEDGARRLFDSPFLARHFSDDVRPHQVYPAVVRFTEMGPRAVPAVFARGR